MGRGLLGDRHDGEARSATWAGRDRPLHRIGLTCRRGPPGRSPIFITCVLFLPFFYKLELYTAYEYLEKRFDLKTRLLAGVIFILLKCFYAAIAIYAPALIVAEMTGLPFVWIVMGVGVLTTFYTTLGGMRAVIWTDTVQFLVLFGGVIVAYFAVVEGVEGGFSEIVAVAESEGKLRFLDWSTSFTTEFTVWGG